MCDTKYFCAASPRKMILPPPPPRKKTFLRPWCVKGRGGSKSRYLNRKLLLQIISIQIHRSVLCMYLNQVKSDVLAVRRYNEPVL